mmetsp:Transcript_20101/g.28892  ORF Transcript_20101/g.28892 Transcript_20101/m.28892 type:complete len:376 (-) Transcript_20101:149-1276(-)
MSGIFLVCGGISAAIVCFIKQRNAQYEALTLLGSGIPNQPVSSHNIKTLNILTHNLWLHYLVPAPNKKKRIDIFLENVKECSDLDVVVIQEAFLFRIGPIVLCSELSNLTKGMTKIGFSYHTNPAESLPSVFGQNSGLIIFSRIPFKSSFSENFDCTEERVNTKGLVGIQLPVSDSHSVHVLGTHLDSRSALSKSWQLHQLQSRIASLKCNASHDVILCGDFNLSPERKSQSFTGSYEEMSSLFGDLENVTETSSGTFKSFRRTPSKFRLRVQQLSCGLWKATWPGGIGNDTIDHIWYTPASQDASYSEPVVSSPIRAESGDRLPLRHLSNKRGLNLIEAYSCDWFHGTQGSASFCPVSDHLGLLASFTYEPFDV